MLEALLAEKEKRKLERSLLEYVKYSFKGKTGKDFLINSHHIEMCDMLERVYRGEVTNLVINVAPRYSKTEIVVKAFSEWCLAKRKGLCKFMHLSYSDALALDNSSEILEDIKSEWYQKHWPLKCKKGKEAKGSWETTAGGEFYATSTLGQVTGFGAGILAAEEFSGALIIDDPLKPEDARSEEMRNKANDRLAHTINSRRNNGSKTPLIIIMQRLHEDDLAGYALANGIGETFEHLCIKAIKPDGTALWPEKHTIEQLQAMQKANPFVFAGQYMQEPIAGLGNLFTADMFEFGPVPDDYDYSYLTMDTSYNEKKENDFTAIMGGKIRDNILYVDKVFRERIQAKDAESKILSFAKHFCGHGFRGAYIEPKGHGIYLNQKLPGQNIYMPSEDDTKAFFSDRRLNKVERANNVVPYLANRKIIINENIPDKELILSEILAFPKAKHDDIVDCLIDMVKLVYAKEVSIFDVL